MTKKIVVFTGNPAFSVRKGIVEIDNSVPGLSWLVLVHTPKKKLPRLLRNQWRNLRRNGWRWIPYQLGDIWDRIRAKFSAEEEPSAFADVYSRSRMEASGNFRFVEVRNLHAEDTLAIAREFAPDLGLSLAAPILRRSLFSIPRLGTVNIHKGKVPDYRGMPPAFWELWNDEQAVGCTVHWIDDKLDTGNIVLESSVDREEYSSLRGLQLRLDEVGVDLMRQAVQRIFDGDAPSVEQAPGGKTNRKPTLAQEAALEKKLRQLQPPTDPGWKRSIKNAYARAAFCAWRWGGRNFLAPRITVLLYHRVSDGARGNLTVGIEQFDRQIELVRKHCHALTIEEVLRHETIPRTTRPLVCITFDDGYLDNYTNAAQILMRHQVPGAFFVSTGLIGTDRRFPHDVRRKNDPIPVMTWDDLRDMRDHGFTIGAHTVNHIDCAAEPEEVVRSELAQSQDDLRRELGLDEVIFAYPYGGRQHMTPERLELVKQGGFSGCLSAYGGANLRTVDRFNVLRRGVHWEFSDAAFLYRCLGITRSGKD
ncbi:MAG: polysaccharide deacetylase family protein [Planctomycetota bacterium]|jgi:peptidoglycan/xylan/chitin deacetylase (PgdA/CDA1 family)